MLSRNWERSLVAAIGIIVGALVVPVLVTVLRPVASVPPPTNTVPSDLSLRIDKQLFAREADRRVGPTLGQYDLRDHYWELGDDTTITLNATTTVPYFDIDAHVRVITRPMVREGGLAVELVTIEYGRLTFGENTFPGLVDSLNAELATAINREKFEVEGVTTTSGAITVNLKVIGEL